MCGLLAERLIKTPDTSFYFSVLHTQTSFPLLSHFMLSRTIDDAVRVFLGETIHLNRRRFAQSAALCACS